MQIQSFDDVEKLWLFEMFWLNHLIWADHWMALDNIRFVFVVTVCWAERVDWDSS